MKMINLLIDMLGPC